MTDILFVYGSLRRGDYNHDRTSLYNATYLGTDTLSGLYMRHNGGYPAVFPTDEVNSKVVVDVYDVSGYDMTWIDMMEHGAGYDKIEMTSDSGRRGSVYIMGRDREDWFQWDMEPEDGVYDWIKEKEAA